MKWGRKVMDLRVKHGHTDRQTVEGFLFASAVFCFQEGGIRTDINHPTWETAQINFCQH